MVTLEYRGLNCSLENMDNLLRYFSYYKDNFVLAICYLIILISIPLTFTMAKQAQIFKSRASEIKPTPIQSQESFTGLKQVPESSPLEELKKATEVIPTPVPNDAASDSESSSSVTFGPTLKFKISLEGRSTNNNAGKVFIGISTGNTTTKPTYLLTFTVNVPASGVYSRLSLAGLTPGATYTAYIKGPGQIDIAESFTMLAGETILNKGEALLLPSGDLNEDNIIDSADTSVVTKLYGVSNTSSNWNSVADFNGDKIVNSADLAYINKNMGKTGASGVWYSPPPSSATSSGTPSGGTYQGGPVTLPDPNGHGRWVWIP